jgi:hypothetical protein
MEKDPPPLNKVYVVFQAGFEIRKKKWFFLERGEGNWRAFSSQDTSPVRKEVLVRGGSQTYSI